MTTITAELRTEGFPSAHAIWHPTPDGDQRLWLWDGQRWLDPIAEIEAQIAELVIPQLTNMFAEGFRRGYEAAVGECDALRSQIGASVEGDGAE